MPDPLLAGLKQHFGFTKFRPGQREALEILMAGRSAAVVFPTGGGKSLCYQLPALLLEGLTLVVSPLIALMKDQIDALRQRGIAARRLDSTLTQEEYQQVMDEVRAGTLKLLYVAPERFNNERFRESMLRCRIALFAIDEAHCISEWGHNFRPDYLKLVEFARTCKAERVLGLTATATREVLDDLQRAFGIAPGDIVCTGFYRRNLQLGVTPVEAAQRDALLSDRLKSRPPGPTIVYVTLQRTAEEVAAKLNQSAFQARAYHAGMENDQRAAVQDWFLAADRGIVVATIAFGMGVDKPDIRYVYHYNLSKSLENYSQEIGRSGRDGDLSICEMFVCLQDLNVLENFVHGDMPTPAAVRSLVGAIFAEPEEFDVSYYDLSNEHDIRLLVVRTLLTYLELQGYLEGGTPFYSQYSFQPLMSSEEICRRFDEERSAFLMQIFRKAKKARTWFTIDVDQLATDLNVPRDRVVRALDYLGEQQMLKVDVKGVRNRYRRLKPCDDLEALATSLSRKMQNREKHDIRRLQQVIELAGHDGCHWRMLSAYFTEKLPQDCGHCAWCLNGRKPVKLLKRPRPALDPAVLPALDALRREHPQLNEVPVAAKFLCGVTSPGLTKAKLSKNPLFGTASLIPWSDLVTALTTHYGGVPACEPWTDREIELVYQFVRELGGLDRAMRALRMIGEND